MNLLTKVTTHRAWIKLKFPAAALAVLLQRTPAARLIAVADEVVAASPVGQLLRSTCAAVASLGAMHALAGATTLLPSSPGPISATTGTPIKQVGFTVTNTINIASWKIGGAIPPGLTFTAVEGGGMVTLASSGTLDATTPGMDDGYGGTTGGAFSTTPVLAGTPMQPGSYTITLQAFEFGSLGGRPSNTFNYTVNVTGSSVVTGPTVTTQPTNQAVSAGGSTTLSVVASGSPTIQWQQNGSNVSGGTGATLPLTNVQPANAGVYIAMATSGSTTVTSDAAIVGVTTASKVIGTGAEIASDITPVAGGNTFDQVLPSGAALAITADPGQITRTSFVDLTGDIVQVEFSGAGTVSLVLDNPSGPALAANYNQATLYMRGHVGVVITGADETTNVSVFSVGRINAVNQALFKSEVNYDGLADIAFIAISTTNGKFGGLRASNASFYATKGLTGIYAPGVAFQGPVFVGDINASDASTPMLIIGSSPDTRITGGDLLQLNGQPVKVAGLTQLKFTAGGNSHGVVLPVQTNKAVLQQNGNDVTAQVVASPAP